jgi:hypothetical protein
MLESGETTGITESKPWQMYALWFVAGCLAATVFLYLAVIPGVKSAARQAGEQEGEQKFEADLAKNPAEIQLQSVKASLEGVTQERDACNAKFDRQTILYDNSVLIDPGKEWIIPADVEPIIVTNRQVSYTHYDPKTKQESVHLKPNKQ